MEAAREFEVKLEGSGNCQSLADHHGFGFPGETTSPVYRCLSLSIAVLSHGPVARNSLDQFLAYVWR